MSPFEKIFTGVVIITCVIFMILQSQSDNNIPVLTPVDIPVYGKMPQLPSLNKMANIPITKAVAPNTTNLQSYPTPNIPPKYYCYPIRDKYGILPGVKWLSPPSAADLATWTNNDCDHAIAHDACVSLANAYNIVPNQSWGSADDSIKASWKYMDCNKNVVLDYQLPGGNKYSKWCNAKTGNCLYATLGIFGTPSNIVSAMPPDAPGTNPDSYLWYYSLDENNHYLTLCNKQNGLCIDNISNSVGMFADNGVLSKQWSYDPIKQTICNLSTQNCIENGGGASAGGALAAFPDDGEANKRWTPI